MCTTVASAARRPAALSPASRERISAVSFQWFMAPPPYPALQDTSWWGRVQEQGARRRNRVDSPWNSTGGEPMQQATSTAAQGIDVSHDQGTVSWPAVV